MAAQISRICMIVGLPSPTCATVPNGGSATASLSVMLTLKIDLA
jgi:hypothetical protein